jgi:hypothetical protein
MAEGGSVSNEADATKPAAKTCDVDWCLASERSLCRTFMLTRLGLLALTILL